MGTPKQYDKHFRNLASPVAFNTALLKEFLHLITHNTHMHTSTNVIAC